MNNANGKKGSTEILNNMRSSGHADTDAHILQQLLEETIKNTEAKLQKIDAYNRLSDEESQRKTIENKRYEEFKHMRESQEKLHEQIQILIRVIYDLIDTYAKKHHEPVINTLRILVELLYRIIPILIKVEGNDKELEKLLRLVHAYKQQFDMNFNTGDDITSFHNIHGDVQTGNISQTS